MPLLMLKDLPQYECLMKAAEHYPALDPTAQIAFLHLLRTADLLADDSHLFYRKHNISHGRFMVLMLLHRPWIEAKTPASLAESAGVTRATMTGLIDTLEKDGLVVRRPDVNDRRITNLELTEEGNRRLEAILPDYFQTMAQLMAPLTNDERLQLVGLLQKIQASLIAAHTNALGTDPAPESKPEP